MTSRLTDLPLWYRFYLELLPFPGRARAALLVAATCAVVIVLCDSIHSILPAYSLYMVFFCWQESSAKSVAMAGLLIVVSTICLLGAGNLLSILVAGSAGFRIGCIVGLTFCGFFLARTTKLGPVASVIAFFEVYTLSLIDILPDPALITRIYFWVWVMIVVPMLVSIAGNLLAGERPFDLLRDRLAQRLQAVAAMAAQPDVGGRALLAQLVREGDEALLDFHKQATRRMGAVRGEAYGQAIALTGRLATVMLALPDDARTADGLAAPLDRLAAWCRSLAASLGSGDLDGGRLDSMPGMVPAALAPPFGSIVVEAGDILRRIAMALSGDRPAGAEGAPPPRAPAAPFLRADAFSNPDHVRFGLKATLAVLICYGTFRILDWNDISTALVTCFFVALGTLEETVHKATLRIGGAVLGGGAGILSILFLMPAMTDIGHLALLIFAGSLVAGWISVGSERISYFGWQAALAFFIVLLSTSVLHPGAGPTLDMQTARDRVLGIVLGNVVMAVVFATIWPVSIAATVDDALTRARDALAELIASAPGDEDAGAIGASRRLRAALAAANRAADYLSFRPRDVRTSRADDRALRVLEAIESLWVSATVLDGLPRDPDGAGRPLAAAMADAVRRGGGAIVEALDLLRAEQAIRGDAGGQARLYWHGRMARGLEALGMAER
ncbi:fusaric acid resistance protein [Gluconacetobacter johannae DSM 13595]|nr:fusaric acid resistance protein [Gluconacetobacter johannae DSM 13595]